MTSGHEEHLEFLKGGPQLIGWVEVSFTTHRIPL